VVNVGERNVGHVDLAALTAELTRLRAENGRLLRLIKLTRREAAPPGPAQAGFFDAPPGLVHAASPAIPRAIPGHCQAAISQNTSVQMPGRRTRRLRKSESVKLFCGSPAWFLSANSVDAELGAVRSSIRFVFRARSLNTHGFRVALPRTRSGVAWNDDAFLLLLWFQDTRAKTDWSRTHPRRYSARI